MDPQKWIFVGVGVLITTIGALFLSYKTCQCKGQSSHLPHHHIGSHWDQYQWAPFCANQARLWIKPSWLLFFGDWLHYLGYRRHPRERFQVIHPVWPNGSFLVLQEAKGSKELVYFQTFVYSKLLQGSPSGSIPKPFQKLCLESHRICIFFTTRYSKTHFLRRSQFNI